MFKAVYFSRFLPTADKGGGARRMLQMMEVIKDVAGDQYEIFSAQRQDLISQEALRKIEDRCNGRLGNKYKFWSEKRRKSAIRLGEISREWSRQIKNEISELKLVFMDDPIYFIPLFEKLKNFHVPIIGICHNLESLATEQVSSDYQRALFAKELDLLSQCSTVVTISREETFLLHNLGINAVFLPYYPVISVLNRLLQVRKNRFDSDKKGIFLLGNVFNLQTRYGMEKMINFWESNRLFEEHGKLIVAGFGTGQYLKNAVSPAVEFYGELTHDALDLLLTRMKACLFFQEKGSGALTRISEMFIAGIPVIANSHAARSYYHMNGLIEFSDLDHLAGALKQAEQWSENIPIPLKPRTSNLIATIQKEIIHNNQ